MSHRKRVASPRLVLLAGAFATLTAAAPAAPTTVLLTGGENVLGRRTMRRLLDRGDTRVILLSNNDAVDVNDNDHDEQLRVVFGNVNNSTLLRHIFAQYEPITCICHLVGGAVAAAGAAVSSSVDAASAQQTQQRALHQVVLQEHVRGTVALLEAAAQYQKRANSSIAHVLLVTNSNAMSENGTTCLDDNMMLPTTLLAASLRGTELFAHTYHHLYRFPTTVLRVGDENTTDIVNFLDRPPELSGFHVQDNTACAHSSNNDARHRRITPLLRQHDATMTDATTMRHDARRRAGQQRRRRRRRLGGAQHSIVENNITHDGISWQSTPMVAVTPHTGHKKVLVTGAAGFIGSHVADMLLARGDDVIIVDEVNDYYDVAIKQSNLQMLRQKYGTERVKFYRRDVANATAMAPVFAIERPQWICHLAARAGVRPSILDPLVYVHANVQGTATLLELSRQYGVQNFVFASSSSVYGGSRSTYFSEDETVDRPISPYAASKRNCELLGHVWHHQYNIPVTALRFFTVYGPRGRPDMAPFKFVDRISRGLPMQQFGDGSSSRDYTYIDDIVDGVVRALDRPYPFQIFNLGKGSGTQLRDFIRVVEKYVRRPANITVLPDQPGDVPYTCADVRKAERLLGYKSKVPFEDGIRRTVEWYQQAYPQHARSADVRSGDEAAPIPAAEQTTIQPFSEDLEVLEMEMRQSFNRRHPLESSSGNDDYDSQDETMWDGWNDLAEGLSQKLRQWRGNTSIASATASTGAKVPAPQGQAVPALSPIGLADLAYVQWILLMLLFTCRYVCRCMPRSQCSMWLAR